MKLKLLLISLLIAAPAWAFAPGNYDITMQAGEDYVLTAVESTNGVPVNLTGNTYAAQFRSAPAPGGVVYATYSASTTSPTTGTIRVKLSAAQTAANSGKSGVWDLKRVDASGQVSYRLSGKCAVKPTVTR